MRRGLAAAAAAAVIAALAVTAIILLPGGGHRARPVAPAPAPRPSTPVHGRTFYVAPTGSDAAAGTSRATAWRTVARVNRARLRPGDTVRFAGGATFDGPALMPGEGTSVAGTAGRPITFGAYGRGRPHIVGGVFFRGENDLVFEDLALGPSGGLTAQGLQGTGNAITVRRLVIAHVALGIETVGDDWRILDSVIRDSGDSGMLLGFNAGRAGDPPGGTDYLVSGNTIQDTGLDHQLTFGTHGIYAKVTRATIVGNVISHFRDDGISIRYRDSVIERNHISDGPIGLGWFQYDSTAGTSRWSGNVMTGITRAAIFICGGGQGCRTPLEHFAIGHNTIHLDGGAVEMIAPRR